MDKIRDKSYTKFNNSLSVQDLHPREILNTMNRAHDAGFESADKMWRDAISEFFRVNHIKQVSFTQLFTIIQNQSGSESRQVGKMIMEED